MAARLDLGRPDAAGDPALPEPVAPMLATLGEPPTDSDFAYEFKWDGIRCQAAVAPGALRLYSRNGRDITDGYPELTELLRAARGHRLLLDGELVALDRAGVASFERLQERMHLQDPSDALVAAVPVIYEVFDLLSLDGVSTVALPYAERRQLLAGLDLAGPAVRIPAHFAGADPSAVMTAARAQGLEGIVAKRLGGGYQPGRRSRDWIKVPFNQTQEVVVIGYKPGGGRRTGTIGSLLVAVTGGDGRLAYAGGVGTGFTQTMLDQLLAMLTPLRRATAPVPGIPRPDARGALWVRPEIVGEVSFRNWTGDGKMRHPAWRGVRLDKTVAQTTRAMSVPPVTEVKGAMVTPDGLWRVEVVSRAGVESFRVVQGDSVLEGLDLQGVEALLARRGVDLQSLRPVGSAA
jgi:bifunctional non-homologous end joining protein LigD